MATVPRNGKSKTDPNNNATDTNIRRSSTPPLPLTEWSNRNNDNEFTFWIDTPSINRATISDYGFSNLTVPQRATLVFGFQIKTKVQVLHFMQKSIMKKMIWEPA